LIGKVSLQPVMDRAGKYLLLLFLASLFSMALNSLYFFLGVHLVWPQVSFVPIILMAWLGPSFYFYVKRLTGAPNFPLGWRALMHWLPGVLLEVILVPYYVLGADEKINFIGSAAGRNLFVGIYLFIYLQILIYIALCQPILKTFNDCATDAELRLNRNWISMVCYGFVSFVIVDGILPHTSLASAGMVYAASMTLYLFIICVVSYAVGHGRVYPLTNARPKGPKYMNSGLRDDTAGYYLKKLDQVMQEQTPYLDSELSLQKLAAILGINQHYLSQILNDNIRKNFYDFINEYRIAHARKLLLDQPDMPIIDVAVAAGYNSRNSFYNSFRRFVGMTPSDFRQKASAAAVN
jgi:AraC-like DNA-binding protein